MSIIDVIDNAIAIGDLIEYLPLSSKPAKRRLLLSIQADMDLNDGGSAINILGVKGYVESALTRWTTGERIFATDTGKAKFLKRLDPPPPEIWEMRITEPNVQVRLFARFAEPDVLIGCRLHTRQMLGKKGSAGWQNAMQSCEQQWVALFGAQSPYTDSQIKSYVTENCDEFAI